MRPVHAYPAGAPAPDGPRQASAGRIRIAGGTDARVAYVRAALGDDRLRLAAQPIVDVRTGGEAGEELLLRLVRPDATIALPTPYLLAAERYPRLMAEVDAWVVERAAALAATGRRLQVNLSGATLAEGSFARCIDAAFARHGTDPSLLTFEITETAAVLDGTRSRECAEQIAALGSHLALDDFGTGYAAFSYLHRLSVSMLKIDREFVSGIAHDVRARRLVLAIVDLAARLGLTTVAEGVEDAETLALLRESGVDRAQGFHLGRPSLPS
jgi:EAL domain-containing protein (putative c-di-GMP-specific phosphodiesterase class I)